MRRFYGGSSTAVTGVRYENWTSELSRLHFDPPVAFAKLRLQETDAVSGTSIFLLQTVESINDCKTKVTTSQTGTLVEPTSGWITGAKKRQEKL